MPYNSQGYNEETPLLDSSESRPRTQEVRADPNDIHQQFCLLSGVPPSNQPEHARRPEVAKRSLYGRATTRRNAQNRTYMFTAALSNTLLLSQVVLGAALTALGASESSHVLITLFGATNTIIAGVVAYLKSRGQPMRARMYRDDLDRVVDEIENSEVMWLGIQGGIHGYDEIAIDDSVSVRSEVARLTRLYDKVVKNNSMNDPDNYMNSVGDAGNAALRARPQGPAPVGAAPGPAGDPSASTVLPVPPASNTADPDASPATAPNVSQTLIPPEDSNKAKSGTDEGAKSGPDEGAKSGPNEGAKSGTDEGSKSGPDGEGAQPDANRDATREHGDTTPEAP